MNIYSVAAGLLLLCTWSLACFATP